MSQANQTVIGIDVGGERKGFHAVALSNDCIATTKNTDAQAIVNWCCEKNARVVAVDAPCRWNQSGSSRLAERELMKEGIHCFFTPSKARAESKRGFYGWMLNGWKLYKLLTKHFLLFDGDRDGRRACIETFPHAVVWAITGNVVPARPKAEVRRRILKEKGYDVSKLTNIDFVDAALCAVAADGFRKGMYEKIGDNAEGFIVVPRLDRTAERLHAAR